MIPTLLLHHDKNITLGLVAMTVFKFFNCTFHVLSIMEVQRDNISLRSCLSSFDEIILGTSLLRLQLNVCFRCRAIKPSSPHVEFEQYVAENIHYVAHAAQPMVLGWLKVCSKGSFIERVVVSNKYRNCTKFSGLAIPRSTYYYNTYSFRVPNTSLSAVALAAPE